jgi:hypothetical protein
MPATPDAARVQVHAGVASEDPIISIYDLNILRGEKWQARFSSTIVETTPPQQPVASTRWRQLSKHRAGFANWSIGTDIDPQR